MMFNFNILQNKRKNFVFEMISKINIKLLITLSCFLFIGTSIYINFESLSNEEIATEEILWLLLGIIFSYLSIIINSYGCKYLINNIGCHRDKFNIVELF